MAEFTEFTVKDMHDMIEKHIERYVRFMEYEKNCSQFRCFPKSLKRIRSFLYTIVPLVEYQGPDFIINNGTFSLSYKKGWNHDRKYKNLYYNDVQGLDLVDFKSQIDDRLHEYFNHYGQDFVFGDRYICMKPFSNNMPKLKEDEIEEILRFHLNTTEIKFTDKQTFNFISKFLEEALKYIVVEDPDYKGWLCDTKINTLYHQAYNRVEHYMNVGGLMNIQPFTKKCILQKIKNNGIMQFQENFMQDITDLNFNVDDITNALSIIEM